MAPRCVGSCFGGDFKAPGNEKAAFRSEPYLYPTPGVTEKGRSQWWKKKKTIDVGGENAPLRSPETALKKWDL